MNEMTLKQYVNGKGMTMEDFSKLTGISASYLYLIQNNRDATGISIKMVDTIYQKTLEKFGEGLDYHQ